MKQGTDTQAKKMAAKKKSCLVILEKKAGNVTEACKAANIDRSQFYAWIKNDDEFARAVNDVQEGLKDFAESKLHAAIRKGAPWAICFFLKCRAKDRGYVERSEMEHSGGIKVVRITSNVNSDG